MYQRLIALSILFQNFSCVANRATGELKHNNIETFINIILSGTFHVYIGFACFKEMKGMSAPNNGVQQKYRRRDNLQSQKVIKMICHTSLMGYHYLYRFQGKFAFKEILSSPGCMRDSDFREISNSADTERFLPSGFWSNSELKSSGLVKSVYKAKHVFYVIHYVFVQWNLFTRDTIVSRKSCPLQRGKFQWKFGNQFPKMESAIKRCPL